VGIIDRWFNPGAPSATTTGRNERGNSGLRPPETPEEWAEEYERRRRVAYGEPYTIGEHISFQIFRAIDDATAEYSPQSIALREDDSMRFVQRVNASALFRGEPSIQPVDAKDTRMDAATKVWTDTKPKKKSKVWSAMISSQGELPMESVKFGDGAVRLVAYDPSMCVWTFDAETSSTLISLEVLAPYLEQDTNERGEVMPGVVRQYKRLVTSERIDVWIDGEHDEDKSGEHGIKDANGKGVIPAAVMLWQPMPSDPTHGVPSSHGMDSAIARIDSMSAQMDAVSKRYANPYPVIKGAKVTDPDIFKFGRLASGLPVDASMEYLEPTMSGLREIREEKSNKRTNIQDTRPEFIFHGAGAAASGEALKVRAAQFEGQVLEVRGTVFSELARLVEIGVAYATGAAYDHADNWLIVDAPPVLPPDIEALLKALTSADTLKIISRADMVAAIQRVGLVPDDVDPTKYAAELEDAMGKRATTFFTPPPEPAQ
jgi:hypothetical protein